ncbi:hypothetical protein HY417_02205 [Candidatus Kaiserbacteria bacterium]|nr:hypothetical protein [Candidatus Kaiserbacteria bacterium]
MFKPHDTNEPELSDAPEDAEFDDAFLRDFPHFTAHRKDVRALGAVRRKFGLGRYSDLNVFVLAHDRDVSAERVFAKDNENNVVFYSTRSSIKKALERRGHAAKKTNLEQHAGSERAEIFIALDPELSITKRLRENIAPEGWVLCRVRAANSLRRFGYTFRAVVDMSSHTPSLSRHDDPAFWKSVQVDSEKAFREASSEKNEGVVTYEEARQKVKEAKDAGISGMSEENVYESYAKLIEMAEEQNPGAAAQGETMLSITVPAGEKQTTIAGINTVLPTKKSEHDDDIVVMRRGLT